MSSKPLPIGPPSHPSYDLRAIVKLALAEDVANQGDVTSMAIIPGDKVAEAYLLAKEDGIIAGIALAQIVFEEVDPSLEVKWSIQDGDYVFSGIKFGIVYGRACKILLAERVVLNFMQRMSGIANMTQAMARAAKPAIILETRKTAPALRLVDKWAVLIGGGRNHRMGLFDMILIKDNHISVAGGISKALELTDLYLRQNNIQMEVEVETRTIKEVEEVMAYASSQDTSLSRILLDNMTTTKDKGVVQTYMLKKAVDLVNGRFDTEASGNITLEMLDDIGKTGVTYISSGALTHSVKAHDISLKIHFCPPNN